MAGILSSALQANHESDHLNYYGVVACKFHSEDNGCEICVSIHALTSSYYESIIVLPAHHGLRRN